MVIKVETDKNDMFKGQQMSPRVTGVAPFHCTQIWRRASSPVLTVGKVNVILQLPRRETYWEIKGKAPEIHYALAETLNPGKPFATLPGCQVHISMPKNKRCF